MSAPIPPCPEFDPDFPMTSAIDRRDWWRARARELVEYARHKPDCCDWLVSGNATPTEAFASCTCGLDELRSAIREAK